MERNSYLKSLISVVLLIMFVMYPLSSASVLDNSILYLESVPSYIDNIKDASLVLMALTSLVGKVENQSQVTDTIIRLVNYIESSQNPDGGWGYYTNEISSPLTTGYALVALGMVKNTNISDISVSPSIMKGINYIMTSFNGTGWGYISNSLPAPYPTVVVLWGLGVNGYTIKNPKILSAVHYLESINNTSPKMIALQLIAYHYIGYTNVSTLLKVAYGFISSENLSISDRAMLTYALTLYSQNLTLEVPKSLLLLEYRGSHNGTFYLTDSGLPILQVDSITPTTFAVMAFASLSGRVSPTKYPSRAQMCNYLISVQNPDGGWGYAPGSLSQPKPTYYALEALSTCNPLPKDAISKAVMWARDNINNYISEVHKRGMLTLDFYYAVLILSKYYNLTPEEKSYLVHVINSYKYSTGVWKGTFSIPQPLQTAMATNLLRALNYTANLETSSQWLLSITRGGWGLLLHYSPLIMTTPNVPTTLLVLESLSNFLNETELRPHLDWLLNQRLDNGFWGFAKESTNMLGKVSKMSPSIEYTVRALELLRKYKYPLDYFNMSSKLIKLVQNSSSVVNIALTLKFASDVGFLPPITLSSVISELRDNKWYVNYDPIFSSLIGQVNSLISTLGGVPEPINDEFNNITYGNHVIVAKIGKINVTKYNPYINVYTDKDFVYINGKKFSRNGLVILIPGRTQNGYILMILLDPSAIPAMNIILNPMMIQYLHGSYVVFRSSDLNGDGKITPDEVRILFEG